MVSIQTVLIASLFLLSSTTLQAAVIQDKKAEAVETTSISQPPPPVPAGIFDRHTFRVSPLEQVSAGKYRIGDILIDKNENSISIPAELNMNTGLLEYVLVRTGGKMHESLLRTSIEPYNLQIACLLAGLQGSSKPQGFQGAPEAPTGDDIGIELRLPDGKIVPPEKWMVHVVEGMKKDVSKLKWVFTGSIVSDGTFAAQQAGSIIATYHDPVAMIDHASPGGETDLIWHVNEDAVPPIGTPVTVVLKYLKQLHRRVE